MEVHWVGGHEGKRATTRMTSKHQRGNVKADANCTAVKRGVRSKVRMRLPRRKSWRLCYDGMEMVGVPRKGLRGETRTKRLMGYFRDTRGRGDEADRWLGEEVLAGWGMAGKALQLHQRVSAVRVMFPMWLTEDVGARGVDHMTDAERSVLSKCAL